MEKKKSAHQISTKRTFLSTVKIRSGKLFGYLMIRNLFIKNLIEGGKINGPEVKRSTEKDVYKTNDRNDWW